MYKFRKKIYLINHVSAEAFNIGWMIHPGTGLFVSFILVIVLSVLLFSPSDDLFGIFKLILALFIFMLFVAKCVFTCIYD